MKRSAAVLVIGICVLFGSATPAAVEREDTIKGNYIEVRSCDVYVAACFANGEVGTTGEEGILTWDVTEGSWNGVPLDGLSIVAVIKANATLGDTVHSPYPANAVLILDQRASEAQKKALTALAKAMGGRLLENIVRIEETEIDVRIGSCSLDGCATVKAEGLVDIAARCLHDGDKRCGNEVAFYPPLTRVDNAVVHATDRDAFWGEGLGVTWDWAGRNSAYLATFSL